MKKILVTGANGQLGQCLKKKSKEEKALDFVFLNSSLLDITNSNQVQSVFSESKFHFCINCAAYTAVDNAEDQQDLAHKINVVGAKNLAEACIKQDTTLIHISTDFVFDGSNTNAYHEEDKVNPLSVYGKTKLGGEEAISSVLDKYLVIRTSWLYSEFGNNFVKTMLRLAKDRDQLSIVNDQFGTPTNANDLAEAIINIVNNKNQQYGVYHYSNLGKTTWYEFAKAIFEYSQTNIKVNPVTSDQFITKAKRPKFSVLDKTKIITNFNLDIKDWRVSLENHLKTTYL
ncbi:MAG: dTDP-4-dehydrorhamnose reductase [Olleya sp.]